MTAETITFSRRGLGKALKGPQQAKHRRQHDRKKGKSKMNCVKCGNPLDHQARCRVHLICAKISLEDLLRGIGANPTLERFRARIGSARTWDALQNVAMLVGQELIRQGRFSGAENPLNRWFGNCIGQMPAREAFRLYVEIEPAPDHLEPRPRREARLAPSALDLR